MKLHLGCGQHKYDGWINVDMESRYHPDTIWNLENFPWPWEDSSISEVMLNHVLEYVGESRNTFIQVICELYRVCRHNACIHIRVPHPRHDFFGADPTHVRPILPETLQLFDKKRNEQWQRLGMSNTPCGLHYGVNFRIDSVQYVLDETIETRIRDGSLSAQAIPEMMRTHNNICKQINIEWRCIKDREDIKNLPSVQEKKGIPAYAFVEGIGSFDFLVHAQPDKFISSSIQQHGIWEPFETRLVQKLLQSHEQPFVLNVGGNIGWYAVTTGLALRGRGKVVTIEPEPTNYTLLQDNLILNGLESSVTALNIALADTCGKAILYLCEDNLGDHRLHYDKEDRKKVTIEQATIDSLSTSWSELPDLLIMDTQGYDGLILRGAKKTFAKGWNPIALFEFWPYELNQTGVSPLEVIRFWQNRGYTLFHIDSSRNQLYKLSDSDIERFVTQEINRDTETHIDIFALPPNISLDIVAR